MTNKFLWMLLIAAGLSFTACNSGNNSKNKTEQTEQKGKEYTSAYICPMHCEGSGSEEPGKCLVCGMDYVKNKDHKDDHSGHNH